MVTEIMKWLWTIRQLKQSLPKSWTCRTERTPPSDDVKRFHLKHHEDNALVLLFMKVAILQQKSKFGHLYKFNAERMANTRIMLPVTDEGTPDYDYMERYTKNLMLRKYKKYLDYLDTKGN